jgi:3'-phosphoadenosine 5'-phosphosulfate sulfotransferase (PAPS reductase)/FAD synthetase
MMKHLVNVSGGAGSAVALFRVIDRYGRENVSARLADTNSEHPDLYRFADDVERVAGIEVVRLKNDGLTIWDVFFREMMFTNPENGGCMAAWHLKKLTLDKHAESFGLPLTIHIGFSSDEDERISRLLKHQCAWQFDFPLTWEAPLYRCEVDKELRKRGS